MLHLHVSNKIIGYVVAIFVAALWGSVSTVGKPILSNVDPLLLSSLVFLISGFTFTPLALRTKQSDKPKKRGYIILIITALIGAALAPALYFLGLEKTTASDTAVIGNGETVFSVAFGLLIFREKLRAMGYLALTLIIVGLFIVTTNFQVTDTLFYFNQGNIFVLAATALWGLDNNLSKIVTRYMDTKKMVQLKTLIGGSVLFLVVLGLGISFNVRPDQIIPIIILGVFGFALSLYLYLNSIRLIGVVKASLVASFGVVFGLIFASIFLNENISIYQMIATIMMLFGIYVMYKYEKVEEIEEEN
jgi:drug/metabolite transporter (DMT)-like permease